MSAPKVSYLVLSYNYEQFIGLTIQSILKQTHEDFEIVIVDDASSDRSVRIVEAFGDSRIRLFVLPENRGGSYAFNFGLNKCRGEWISNVDSDDIIHPRKTELSLLAAEADPDISIIGTWIKFIDSSGHLHANYMALEGITNLNHDLNKPSNWTVLNPLARSSTLVRKSAYDAVGLSDESMTRAPDFEIWTRMLRAKLRFHLVEKKLTMIRVHDGTVTHGDPKATFRELAYSIQKNLVATYSEMGLVREWTAAVNYFSSSPLYFEISPVEAKNILGLLVSPIHFSNYQEFLAFVIRPETEQAITGNFLFLSREFDPGVAIPDQLSHIINSIFKRWPWTYRLALVASRLIRRFVRGLNGR